MNKLIVDKNTIIVEIPAKNIILEISEDYIVVKQDESENLIEIDSLVGE